MNRMGRYLFKSNILSKVDDTEYNTIIIYTEALKAAARLTNDSLIVVDFSKEELVFLTRQHKFMHEATIDDKQRECTNPYWSLMSKDDLEIFFDAQKAYLDLFENLSEEEKSSHIVVWDYNIILNRHKYTITQKFTPLKLTKDGKLWLGLFYYTVSSHKTGGNILFIEEHHRYTYDLIQKKFVLQQNYEKLTKIEKAIIHRSFKGLTTEQTAKELYKSVDTIKTYKKRLFKKFRASSMNEAIVTIENYNYY